MKFSEYVIEWKENARLNTSEGWKLTQDQMMRDHIIPYLGNQDLDSITPMHISKVLSQSKMRGHSSTTTKQIYLLLSKLFNDAVQFFEIIERSPVKRKYHSPKCEKSEQAFLRILEIERLLFYVKDHWAKEAVYIQCLVGMRVSEVMALKWKDIEFNTQSIFIRSAYKRKTKKIENYPKNQRQMRVPLKGRLLEFLQELKKLKKPKPNDFVCSSAKGQMLSYHAYQKAVKILCRKAGVTSITTHGLRHSCSELWVTLGGATAEDIRRLFNQKTITATSGYIHRTEDRLTEIADRVMKKPSVA